MPIYIDNHLPVVKYHGLNVENSTVTLPSTTTIGGSTVSALGVVTSVSANAISVGRQGSTDPVFNVDASTATQADGVNITGGASGAGVAIAGITAGTNAPMTIDAVGSGTIAVGGTSTGIVLVGEGSASRPIEFTTITVIDAQNGTPSAAACLGGVIKHNSKTGAGTVTFPTGTQLSSAIVGVAVGATFKCLYYNYGNQTATLTTGASGTTVIGGTAAVTTGKWSEITFLNTAANTWDVFLQTLM